MVKLTIGFYNVVKKFFYSVWGLTIVDLLPIFDFHFLDSVNSSLKTFVAVIGSIYFVIQLVFKTIELNHKRKYNKGLRKLQDEEIEMRERENDYMIFRKDYLKRKE